MTDRAILHCDLNNFYASVETLLHPELKGRAVAVCGDPEKRHGIVLAKSEAAKAAGVKTAEAIWQAKLKCPELITVPPTYKEYLKYSRMVKQIYLSYTSEVESFGLDECWLDVTGSKKLFGSGEDIAEQIRRRVKEETGGLTVSVGVSFNKIFAKLGSDLKKPDAVTVINRGNFREKVWKLNVGEMLFIGHATTERLKSLGIVSIGDLAVTPDKTILRVFGKNGLKMLENARGENSDPVKSYTDSTPPESVGNGVTTPEDVSDAAGAAKIVYALGETVAFRLRALGMKGETVALDLRSNDLKHISRQGRLPYPSDSADTICAFALELMKNYDFSLQKPLRTITLTVSSLSGEGDPLQASLFEKESEKSCKLDKSIDNLRKKYGFGVLKRGVNMDSSDAVSPRDEGFLPFDKR